MHNEQVYFYLKNAQGDIVGIADSAGTEVATYVYDSWGKLISINDTSGVNIGELNPLRYRGYYFDSETGLYYLNARYYDPETGRFINADDNLSDLNLFAYCENNPINFVDPSGLDCHIFYGPDQAESAKLAEMFFAIKMNEKVCMHFIEMSPTFEAEWNGIHLSAGDIISIMAHGDEDSENISFESLRTPNPNSLLVNIGNLKPQNDCKILLQTCYGGREDKGEDSVASRLLIQTNARSVKSVDGFHARRLDGALLSTTHFNKTVRDINGRPKTTRLKIGRPHPFIHSETKAIETGTIIDNVIDLLQAED